MALGANKLFNVQHAVFLVYGSQFARVLHLPDKPNCHAPMIIQLPERYQPYSPTDAVRPLPSRYLRASATLSNMRAPLSIIARPFCL
jgi:hypothetical protein